MKFNILVFIILNVGLIACSGRYGQDTTVRICFENLKIDSCRLQLYHAISGKEIKRTSMVNLNNTWRIDTLADDMYILLISWPKTFLSHKTFKNPLFDKDGAEDFQLTKPIFINKSQALTYTVHSKDVKDKSYFELNGVDGIFVKSACMDCQLADDFWSIYTVFFDRKEKLLDSLNQRYYIAVDNNQLEQADELYKSVTTITNEHYADEQLDREIMDKISLHPTSVASTYFLFYQLYHYRDFPKYQDTYDLLTGLAKSSKYYTMVTKQYQLETN